MNYDFLLADIFLNFDYFVKFVILSPKNWQNSRLIVKLWTFLEADLFKMHDFLHKYATISSKIGKIHYFSRLMIFKGAFFSLLGWVNTLLFRLLLAKFEIFTTN